ncbi:MAG: divergent PAP2 family protein [Treponema sp.]|nr:divergent PAP2 family protein [Treponema sp.]
MRLFFENIVFLSSFLSLCIAQLLKGLIFVFGGRARRPGEIARIIACRTGGMPSSHSAVVCSLSASIAFSEGLTSNIFVFSLWFALVVLRDAVGVRRSAGLLARALNGLGRAASEKLGIDFHLVKEVQGHTPLEVVVGALLGIFISAALFLL